MDSYHRSLTKTKTRLGLREALLAFAIDLLVRNLCWWIVVFTLNIPIKRSLPKPCCR